ncbi:hypothetical protein EDD11_006581 [Mortierella claussenii]|nr:hypothetical protein EDD11_006581 [Mortierella claussenii]
MFPDAVLFNSTSASSVANPAPASGIIASDPAAESALFHTLFAMPAPINTISQDFCLFDQDEASFDYPLFNAAATAAVKTFKTSSSGASQSQLNNYFNNPLCTPQTPSLDLNNHQVAAGTGLGFDSCTAFLEDSVAAAHHLIDTPFTPYLDTPSLDTPLETPYLADLTLDSDMDAKLGASAAAFPLFSDFGFDFTFANPFTVEPNMIMAESKDANDTLPSPVLSILSSAPTSPVTSVLSDFSEEDDDEFVPSRSAALVSGLKRKAAEVDVSAKKTRTDEAFVSGKKSMATKRFSCNHPGCDRQFARLFNLHTHEKTHDPEQARPFTCPDAECAKAFSRKHDLQRHEASVHKGERNFACNNCHKPFSRQDGLRRHLAVKGPCSDNAWLAT